MNFKKLLLGCILFFILLVLSVFIHELGHAFMWHYLGFHDVSLHFDNLPFGLYIRTDLHGKVISDLNRIIISCNGVIFACVFSIVILVIFWKFNKDYIMISYIIMITQLIQLIIPFGSDLANIYNISSTIGFTIQMICIVLLVLLYVLILKNVNTILDHKTTY